MQIQMQEVTIVKSQTAQPAAAAQPAAPASARAVITGPGGTDVIELAPLHLTSRDVAALKARRSEISNQLESVDGRRSKLLSQLRSNGDEVAKKGLEDRLALLDKRQLQLEADLAETGRQLSSIPAGQLASTEDRNVFGSVNSAAMPVISVVFTIFVLGPLAIGVAKSMWRRASRTGPPTAMITETAQRLERLEQSVDAIALEIERVSEGQRFVTQLLSDAQPALAAPSQRAATPVRSGQ
jgi:hypothetical protein